MRTWLIGSRADCDLVVAEPKVSGRHCRFTELADGGLVEDLGSSNGTYVNGVRISGTTHVSASDRITLGALVPMPWPPASSMPWATVLRIGRATAAGGTPPEMSPSQLGRAGVELTQSVGTQGLIPRM